ncbi:MAG: lipopolysaccharide heptosyltransferase I [Rugosibacter sp.]|nr:lipopolysaccharide heptosyltransferase I [Rugosibacter sp.]
MRILLIKTSSLGDVVHNLPAATDLRAAYPEAVIDWVVEEAFAAIPRLHPGIDQVIPVALRRWRKTPLAAATWREVAAFRRTLAAQAYDLIIDTQGLLKSALIARLAQGLHCGYDAASARETLATRFYERTCSVPKALHAIARNRQLAALAAGYTLPAGIDYGIAAAPQDAGKVGAGETTALQGGRARNALLAVADGNTALLLTATSRSDKLWPEDRWIALGQALSQRGLTCLLPAGTAAERARTARLAAAIPAARALPPLDLRALAQELAAARIVIGVDTGLVHLAAALGRPTLALFCASEPTLTGVLAGSQSGTATDAPAINLGHRGAPPTVAEVLTHAEVWL